MELLLLTDMCRSELEWWNLLLILSFIILWLNTVNFNISYVNLLTYLNWWWVFFVNHHLCILYIVICFRLIRSVNFFFEDLIVSLSVFNLFKLWVIIQILLISDSLWSDSLHILLLILNHILLIRANTFLNILSKVRRWWIWLHSWLNWASIF